MERLQALMTVMAGLVLGLRGRRREAMETLLDEMEKTFSDISDIQQEERDREGEISRYREEEISRLVRLLDDAEAKAERARVEAVDKVSQMRKTLLATLSRYGLEGPQVVLLNTSWMGERKIGAIKIVRIVLGCGLKEAKDWVEQPRTGEWVKVGEAPAEALGELLAELDRMCGEVGMQLLPKDEADRMLDTPMWPPHWCD